MNNHRSPRDPRDHLLADTLHDDWASGPASAMARRAAASARRRRTVRRGSVVLGATAALVALVSFALRRESLVPSTSLASAPVAPTTLAQTAPVAATSTSVVTPTSAAKTPGYEIVSDEEFFALLRDRPLLVLPEEKGPKKFIVLAY